MKRVRNFLAASFVHKLLVLLPAITFLFWLLPGVFYIAFLAKETNTAFGGVGAAPDVSRHFFLTQVLGYLIIGLAALAGQVGLIIVVAQHISRPLRRLARHVAAMQPCLGSIPQLLEENEVNSDEAAQLSRSINRFVRTVAGYETRLKEQAHLAAIGETAGMVAHDVRKPLTAMKALLRVLPQRKDEPGFLVGAQRQVGASISQAEGLLADILEFSNNLELQREPLDPQSIITSAIGDSIRRRPDSSVRFTYDLRHEHGILGDRARLLRVIGNITDNAIQAMDGKGVMHFSTRTIFAEDVPWMEVTVGNDGPVIPSVCLSRLFDPFFTKGKRNGTGLGLAICRRLVEAHGGTIDVTSVPGSTAFSLILPGVALEQMAPASELIADSIEITRYQPADAGDRALSGDSFGLAAKETTESSIVGVVENERRSVPAGNRPSPEKTPVILVLNDDDGVRMAIVWEVRRIISSAMIVEAGSVADAVEKLNGGGVDLILADIDLGDGAPDGYSFLKHVRENVNGIPFYFCSGADHRTETPKAIASGANGFLRLPLLDERLSFLKQIVGSRSGR